MSTFARQIKTVRAASGAELAVMPFGASGVVSLSGSVAGGHMHSSRAIAELHASMLTEGTRRKSKAKLQELFDAMGTSVSFTASADRLEFSAKLRREHLAEVLSLIVEMLAEPAFPANELATLKKRTLGVLALEAENTRAQSGIALSRLLYEKGHPNRAEATEDMKRAIMRVSPRDLRAHHKRTVFASTLILAMAGAVGEQDLARAAKIMSKLPKGAPKPPAYPSRQGSDAGAAVAFVPAKESVDYQLGVRTVMHKDDPQFVPLLLAVNILGRPGFAGRLMQKVREEQGLTYGTYAFLRGFSRQIDGHVSVWATFAPSLFEKGRASVRAELSRLSTLGPTEAEFTMHRDLYVANWYVRLAKTDAIADAIHDCLAEGEAVDYLDRFPQMIKGAKFADVAQACRDYLVPSRMAETAAGTLEKDALSA